MLYGGVQQAEYKAADHSRATGGAAGDLEQSANLLRAFAIDSRRALKPKFTISRCLQACSEVKAGLQRS